jgi:hypothetical protein
MCFSTLFKPPFEFEESKDGCGFKVFNGNNDFIFSIQTVGHNYGMVNEVCLALNEKYKEELHWKVTKDGKSLVCPLCAVPLEQWYLGSIPPNGCPHCVISLKPPVEKE